MLRLVDAALLLLVDAVVLLLADTALQQQSPTCQSSSSSPLPVTLPACSTTPPASRTMMSAAAVSHSLVGASLHKDTNSTHHATSMSGNVQRGGHTNTSSLKAPFGRQVPGLEQ